FVADTQRELTRLPVSFTRLSDEDEIQIGNDLAQRYLSMGSFAKHDPAAKTVQAYVDRVGARVAVQAHRKLPYKFHYVSDPDFINAFALPGGHVFIGGGLIALMDSEDQLANVLGHEIEHIDHYHCAERVQTEMVLRNLPLGSLMGLPVEIFEAGYSKAQELEADREGTRLAVKAGYSPLGAVRMFQVFNQLYQQRDRKAQTPQEELSSIAQQTLEGYFRSHPIPSERIAQIQKMMTDEHWENLTSERTLEVAYVFLTERAARAISAENYVGAEKAATRSLELHPDQPEAIKLLAEAQFAQEEFPRARENYRKLVDKSPAEAGAVAEFANIIAVKAMRAEHYDQAAKLATASLDLQPNNAKGLVTLAEAQMALSDFEASAATYRKLKRLYPDEAQYVLSYIRSFTIGARDLHHYDQTAKVAEFWLTLEPNQTEALNLQADGELAMGNFLASARACRNLLDLSPKDQYVDIDLVKRYANALSAAQAPQQAAKDFETFMARPREVTTSALEAQIKIEWAGLMLMAGNNKPAGDLISQAQAGGTNGIAPELLHRLAWWYYRAAQYPAAEALYRSLTAQRPGDVTLQYDLGWTEIEQNKSESAIRRFTQSAESMPANSPQWSMAEMGLAVALWKSPRTEDAMKDYDAAVVAEPRWLNQRSVRAFYSPRVAQAITQMQAEHEKRLEAKRRHP
ncbi:MAG TPA: M48 family metalloprotease, partial [Terriglobia bacterium]|nr:M48 family metalloprotease [Terriglobia bacterium]